MSSQSLLPLKQITIALLISALFGSMVISIKPSSEMEKKHSAFDLACRCSPAMFVTVNQPPSSLLPCISISWTYSSLGRTAIDKRTCPTGQVSYYGHVPDWAQTSSAKQWKPSGKTGDSAVLLQPNNGNLQEKLGIQQELTPPKWSKNDCQHPKTRSKHVKGSKECYLLGQNTRRKSSGQSLLSSYKTTLKQQLNSEQWEQKEDTYLLWVELCCCHVQCL